MVARIGLKGARPVRTYFKEWRDWKGWSQQELADRLDTTAATVSRIETGQRDWSKGYLEAFAHVVGCPDPADPIMRPPPQPNAPPSLDALVKDAPPEVRTAAVEIIRALLKAS